jgi:hypothetical protein
MFFEPYIGDPTLYPGFDPHPLVFEAIRESLNSKRYNGYRLAHGTDISQLPSMSIWRFHFLITTRMP